MKQLLAGLQHSRQRQLVVLRGSEPWCDNGFAALESLPAGMLVLSNRELGDSPVAFGKADGLLGREADLVVLDLFTGFNPDVLCIAAGLVRAGGVLALLAPDEWRPQSDLYAEWQNGSCSARPRFADYFFRALEADGEIGLLLEAESEAPALPQLPWLDPLPVADGPTPQQADCLQRIEQWLAANRAGVVLLTADRGRGKSSCLGMLVARLQKSQRVLVCADSRRGAAPLLRWAEQADFVAPDRLLLENPQADLVVIDEAAMIPASLLRQVRRLYPRLVMATTTGGYEGTGQGFMLRFVAALEAEESLRLELTDPVRWCSGDCLEAWLNRVLMLDIEPAPVLLGGADPASVRLQLVADPGAPEFGRGLKQVYRLLKSAHYRTRPSDLRMLMENPDLELLIACSGENIVGAALLNREGGLDAELCGQVFLGQRRPKGHLLAQMLTAQAGIERFAGHRGLRVQRIAVEGSWRRLGLGTRLIEHALEHARSQGLQYVGASFALDAQTAGFWQQAGFSLAHVSYAPGKSSGNNSIAVLFALSADVAEDLQQLQRRIQDQLPAWMTQFLQVLGAEEVAALLRFSAYQARLNQHEQREIEAFAHGNRGFELCFVSLQQFCMQLVARSSACPDRLLIEKAIQNRHWRQLEREHGGEGRKQLQKRLRRLVEAGLKAC